MIPTAQTSPLEPAEANAGAAEARRPFDFDSDTFSFANELVWEYRFGDSTEPSVVARNPKPAYTHRCFVLVRAARQFFHHVRFDPSRPAVGEREEARLVARALARSPRAVSNAREKIVVPGYLGLRDFSLRRERLLKSLCGGAWRSYALRSHWRMVFPISRQHQRRAALALTRRIESKGTAVVHLVRFPSLTINHGLLLFACENNGGGCEFGAYDPNDHSRPARLRFDRNRREFTLPKNSYWPGGRVDVIEIFTGWMF